MTNLAIENARLRAVLEMIAEMAERPISRPMEVGSRHGSLTRAEGLDRYAKTCELIAHDARAAISSPPARDWRPIETAPKLDRVFIAGWQPRNGNTIGYWWFYEDMTDEHGVPMDHPDAKRWRPLPAPPNEGEPA